MLASTTPDKQCRTQFISKIGSEFINRLGILLYQVLWNCFKRLLNIAFGFYQIHNLLEFWKDIYPMRYIVFEVVTKVNKKLSGILFVITKNFNFYMNFWRPQLFGCCGHCSNRLFSNRIKCKLWINKWVCLPDLFLKQNLITNSQIQLQYTRWLGVKILHIQIVTQFPTNYSFTVKIAQTYKP